MLLVGYGVLLLWALLAPSSSVQSRLVVETVQLVYRVDPSAVTWFTYPRAEVVANVVIVAPLTYLTSLMWPRTHWQHWTAYGFVGATCIELFQGLVLSGRDGSFSDIVANTTGALLGAVLARLLVRLVAARRRARSPRSA